MIKLVDSCKMYIDRESGSMKRIDIHDYVRLELYSVTSENQSEFTN
jgi:hypothetical protein